MKKLGIRTETNARQDNDHLSPTYPLIAFCYYRSGFIRLAGKNREKKA